MLAGALVYQGSLQMSLLDCIGVLGGCAAAPAPSGRPRAPNHRLAVFDAGGRITDIYSQARSRAETPTVKSLFC